MYFIMEVLKQDMALSMELFSMLITCVIDEPIVLWKR